ncbi:hypothetical protein TL16_g08096 [Triparma laevis f. inornata]|uniref:Uncharacterized protein n=1 Tax=Triparma laevis f. inornata TaxID=1714386 RepID=A0A9W7EIM3_9STRA|nr:hypothetical protein TL16_g08096 [Triparma laevis f. inornata]
MGNRSTTCTVKKLSIIAVVGVAGGGVAAVVGAPATIATLVGCGTSLLSTAFYYPRQEDLKTETHRATKEEASSSEILLGFMRRVAFIANGGAGILAQCGYTFFAFNPFALVVSGTGLLIWSILEWETALPERCDPTNAAILSAFEVVGCIVNGTNAFHHVGHILSPHIVAHMQKFTFWVHCLELGVSVHILGHDCQHQSKTIKELKSKVARLERVIACYEKCTVAAAKEPLLVVEGHPIIPDKKNN